MDKLGPKGFGGYCLVFEGNTKQYYWVNSNYFHDLLH